MGHKSVANMRIQIEETRLSDEQIALFTETFRLFDKDGSGTIDTEEFRAVCETIGMTPTESELQLMLLDVDANNSGDIDLEEFIEAMRRKYVDNEAPELMRSAFEIFDTDGSGCLSYEEMNDVLTNLGEDMSPDTIRRLIELADADGNGEI